MNKIWHPMTQHGLGVDEIAIDRAEGAYLHAGDRRILDAISSWWVVTHGHGHPRIVEAVQRQAGELSQIIFAGLTHGPAERLAEALLARVQPQLEHVFYSDSGSTAVEVAIKMAVGFHAKSRLPRHKILALEGGYHGDTFGAMAAGSRGVFNDDYAPMLFEVEHVALPSAAGLPDFKALVDTRGDEFAAFVFEPLVQGSAGMRMYDAGALRGYSEICRDAGILLIADEVMTGFGRLGEMFACDIADVAPDLMCLSKGLTGGFLPMGATLSSRAIYEAFYSDNRADMFMHSTSFTANPLACAAAIAALEVWDEEDAQAKIDAIADIHAEAAVKFRGMDGVADVRTMGTIFAVELGDAEAGYLSERVPAMMAAALERDVLLRPIGNVIYILPPYCVSRQDLDRIYRVIEEIITL